MGQVVRRGEGNIWTMLSNKTWPDGLGYVLMTGWGHKTRGARHLKQFRVMCFQYTVFFVIRCEDTDVPGFNPLQSLGIICLSCLYGISQRVSAVTHYWATRTMNECKQHLGQNSKEVKTQWLQDMSTYTDGNLEIYECHKGPNESSWRIESWY